MKRLILFILIFTLFYTFLLGKEINNKKEIIVKVKDRLETSSNTVKLKDLALIIGDNRLNNIVVLQFRNAISDSYLINKQLIFNSILNFYLKNKEPVPDIKIFSKKVVKIIRKSYFITSNKIKQIIEKFLEENSKKIFHNKKWKLVKILCPEKIKINSSKVDLKVTLLNEKKYQKLPFVIDFIGDNNKKIKSIRIFAITEVKDKFVIAKKNIFIRKIITIDDIKVTEAPVKNSNQKYIKAINDVVGRMATRFIREGEPITENMIKLPPMVHRGQIVNVVAKSISGIVISTKAKALESGYYNKDIRVLNMASGKVFLAKVKGYGKVEVKF